MPKPIFSIRQGLVVLMLASALGLAATSRADDRAGFGTQWVRDHPFTINAAWWRSASVTAPPVDFTPYLGMNLNNVFVNTASSNLGIAQAAASTGLPWTWHYGGTTSPSYKPYDFAQQALINQTLSLGGATAFMLSDEPKTPEDVQAVAQSAQWIRQHYPDLLVYANVYQSDPGFLNLVADTIQPDLLSFDNYPFKSNGTTDSNGWFKTLMNVRAVSLAHQIPYGAWLQSYTYSGNDVRTPSESDTRYNGFTLLTAGYKMLTYYVYREENPSGGVNSTLIDPNGNPTTAYHQAAAANLEYANLGESLRFLTSTDVRFVPGRRTIIGSLTTTNSTPTGLTTLAAAPISDPHIQSVSIGDNQLGSEKNGLIGFFTDDDNSHYFMLTNLNHGAGLSAADAALSFNIVFDSSVNSIWRLNRLTGTPEEILLSNHVLSLILPGGTGDLFKYDNGNFAGVPEPTALMILGLGGAIFLSRRH